MTKTRSNNLPDGSRPPVIILGAARSGTKLLRALVAATGQYAVVPYDVNYIWRYKNESYPHDALALPQQTEGTRTFVRRYLPRCAVGQAFQPARNYSPQPEIAAPRTFVEKTVSNILRIPFVKSIYPQAKFIAIIRDGRDVVESAERCWRQSPSAGYLLAKLRTFPWRHCAPYAWKVAARTVRRQLRVDSHLRSWGPRYPGIDNDLRTRSLLEVCARQWLACIEHYERSRQVFVPHQLLELQYEDLIHSSTTATIRLCNFLEVDDCDSAIQFAHRTITSDRLGSSRRLQSTESQRVFESIRPAVERWGYNKELAA